MPCAPLPCRTQTSLHCPTSATASASCLPDGGTCRRANGAVLANLSTTAVRAAWPAANGHGDHACGRNFEGDAACSDDSDDGIWASANIDVGPGRN